MEFNITEQEQKILLSQARETIKAELERRRPSYESNNDEESKIGSSSNVYTPCGAFVSLHIEPGHSLRGCIGRMAANFPLIETVRIMSKEAAFGDPRFPPVRKEELSVLHIEISALSPFVICHDPASVKVGVHGLYLICKGRSGVLLPQVPVEQGWNRDEYLDYICVKAGLPPDSYKARDAQLYTFTAIVFGEDR
ncbi:MAG: AmmeMemoRadiSam system protein A [Treponema sp.]|nr:AmmeMemoRadiSam system protein A [Treponema sp.]